MDPNQANAQQTKFIESPKLHGELGKSVTEALRLKEPSFSEHSTVTSLVEELVKDENLINLFGEYVQERISECSGQYEKIAAHSKVLREKGNAAYQKKKFDEALQLYDESVVFATGPPDSTSLALAYANRSAVLFEKKAYQKCLKDIERALSNGYSENLKYKLYRRQAECYLKSGRVSDALRSADSALEASASSDLADSKKSELINDLKNLRNKICDASKSDDTDKPSVSNSEQTSDEGLDSIIQETELAHGNNPKLPTVSSLLKVGYNEHKGRHMLADSNLHVNDILIVERPYACILFLEYINYHCWNCTVNLVSEDVAISTVPCDNCTEVRYCSEKCRDQAWEEFHYFECGCLTMLPDFGYPHLPIRIILNAGVQKVLQTKDVVNSPPQASDNDLLESFAGCTAEAASYNTIRSLQSHQEKAEFSAKWDAVVIALLSLKWIEICYKRHLKYMCKDSSNPDLTNLIISEVSNDGGVVQNGDMFPQGDDSSFRLTIEQRTVLASSLVLHYFQCKCNSYSITELYRYMSECSTVVGQIADRTIAVAVYPSFSLFNHDCDPNVGTFPYRNVMIGRAIKSIGTGKEACISYGTTWWEAHVQLRREFLQKNFSFNCTCRSCQSDQANQDKFLKPPDANSAPSKQDMSLLHVLDLFHRGNDNVPQEQYVQAVELILECLTLLCKDVKDPRKNFTRIYWKSNDQLLLCFERMISQCTFDGDQQKHLCSFNTCSIRYASADRLIKMQAALKQAMQCVIDDVESGRGRESDLLCNIALDYVCALLKITRQRTELCFDEDWYGLAKESLDIMKKILLLKKGLGGVGSNLRVYSQFVEDICMVLECWVAEGEKQTLTHVVKDEE